MRVTSKKILKKVATKSMLLKTPEIERITVNMYSGDITFIMKDQRDLRFNGLGTRAYNIQSALDVSYAINTLLHKVRMIETRNKDINK